MLRTSVIIPFLPLSGCSIGLFLQLDAESIGAFSDDEQHSRADDLLELAKVCLRVHCLIPGTDLAHGADESFFRASIRFSRSAESVGPRIANLETGR